MKKTLQQRVLEVLRDNPGVSVKELASLLGVNANRVKAVAYRLKSMGYIEKAGRGYIATERGLQFLEYLERFKSPTGETGEEAIRVVKPISEKNLESKAEVPVGERPVEEKAQSTLRAPERVEGIMLSDIIEKLREFDKRLSTLEAQVRNIEKAIEAMRKKTETTYVLEVPAMYYNDAVAKHGSLVEKMLSDKKLVRVGSLVVDAEFYSYFKSKFPIRLSDVEKLPPYEKLLLEEMRKEALVVLHAGKEYRLVE